jgi:alkylhydroperoxidase family enzyme
MNREYPKPRRHAEKIQKLVDSVLNSNGDSAPAIRLAVEQIAAARAGRPSRTGGQLPAEIVNYVDKVDRNAHKVTDADIEALRAVGFTEDAIFELTICAALGAGLARLKRGLAAMKGGADAAQKD